MAIDDRWPRVGPAANELTGVVSMLSHPLFLEVDDSLGALNLYATRPAAFSEDSMTALTVLATHSAIAMARTAALERSQHLQAALNSNRTIGIAIGILMNQHLITSGPGLRHSAVGQPAFTPQTH
jgi:GAF domain-containing protein